MSTEGKEITSKPGVAGFLKDSWAEITERVTWPTYKELQGSTIVVLVASLIFATVLWLIDVGFNNLMDFLIY